MRIHGDANWSVGCEAVMVVLPQLEFSKLIFEGCHGHFPCLNEKELFVSGRTVCVREDWRLDKCGMLVQNSACSRERELNLHHLQKFYKR